MFIATTLRDPRIVAALQRGGVGVLRTDTLYGLVASADNEAAVERVYVLKRRDDGKSPIVLIADIEQMFDQVNERERHVLDDVWPGKVSVIMPARQAPAWLTRGNESVAYRLPEHDELRQLLRQTGPLIAPSANVQSQPPAMTVAEAMEYFGDAVDFYVDGGRVTEASPSHLIRVLGDGHVERLR